VSPDELLNLTLLVLTIGDNIAENHNERIGELEAWRARRAKKKRKAERGVPSQ
jgi:hypothetical protein